MPEFTFGNADLKVEPAAPEGWTFAAGDTIIGTVVRRSSLITPEATLRLFFRGKLKVVVSDDSRSRLGRPPLTPFGPATSPGRCAVDKPIFVPKEGLLFEGPLHIQDNTEPTCWPFQIEIPSSPDYATKTKEKLPSFHEALCRGPLPGSFISTGRGETSCWIEYYLDAQLHYIHGGEKKVCQSTHLIKIRHPLGPEFQGFGSQRTKFELSIQSYHLIPGLESEGLSFKQKRRQLFGSSKIPCFHYAVEIAVPKTIPLNNSAPIPIEARCLTLSNTSPKLKESPPKVWLTRMNMFLKFTTSTWQDGGIPSLPWGTQHWEDDLGLQKIFENADSEKFQLEISTGEKGEPLDIGQVFQLSLYTHGLKAGERYLNRTLAIKPDFNASYIKHTHTLTVEVSVMVADQIERMRWDWPVTIV